ncbi:MAG: disulfide bond formation protein B [Hyphomonadaceae bacterium]
MLSSLRPIWPLLSLLVSGALLAGAHAFQYFGGLQPCPLCLDQRNWHWGIVGLSIVALVALRLRPGLARWAAVAIGVLFVASFVQGAHHVAVEHGLLIAECDARVNFNNLDFNTIDPNARVEAPKCDQVQWSLLGVSMAGYNALISLVMALLSFVVAFAPARKS